MNATQLEIHPWQGFLGSLAKFWSRHGRLVLFVGPVLVLTGAALSWPRTKSGTKSSSAKDKKSLVADNGAAKEPGLPLEATAIEPLEDFRWWATEPLQLRPFKPAFHITMAIEKAEVSELIQIDKHYQDRIAERVRLIADHHDDVIKVNTRAEDAVTEFYTWLIGQYLPQRYPTMFQIRSSDASTTECSTLVNVVTGDSAPLAPPADPVVALEVIGRQVEEDFMFLFPSTREDGGMTLEATVGCFPSGFTWAELVGKSLAAIHVPVPDYTKKLKGSMDRYLNRIVPGTYVKRANWSISTTNRLYAPAGMHLHEGQEVATESFEPSEASMRCERQTLYRLPKSGAVIFGVRTYLYPLSAIKAEGNGESLATAIDGFKNGSSPGFHLYKRAIVWGDAMKAYLRA